MTIAYAYYRLAPGDCGAWVVDPGSGCLHGIVVASSQGLNVTYIIPAHRVLGDINQRLGGKLGGPEDMLPKGDVVPWSPAIDKGVVGPRWERFASCTECIS